MKVEGGGSTVEGSTSSTDADTRTVVTRKNNRRRKQRSRRRAQQQQRLLQQQHKKQLLYSKNNEIGNGVIMTINNNNMDIRCWFENLPSGEERSASIAVSDPAFAGMLVSIVCNGNSPSFFSPPGKFLRTGLIFIGTIANGNETT